MKGAADLILCGFSDVCECAGYVSILHGCGEPRDGLLRRIDACGCPSGIARSTLSAAALNPDRCKRKQQDYQKFSSHQKNYILVKGQYQ